MQQSVYDSYCASLYISMWACPCPVTDCSEPWHLHLDVGMPSKQWNNIQENYLEIVTENPPGVHRTIAGLMSWQLAYLFTLTDRFFVLLPSGRRFMVTAWPSQGLTNWMVWRCVGLNNKSQQSMAMWLALVSASFWHLPWKLAAGATTQLLWQAGRE